LRWFTSIGQISFSEAGQPVRIVGITLDVHERKLVEQRLRDSNDDLQRFAYAVSHDLQEPLRVVASFTELLWRRCAGQLDSQSDEYIRYITNGVCRMQALIEGLLQYSRVTHEADLPLAPVDCNLVLGLALQQLQFRISETGACITFDPLPLVRGNEGRLVQVFQNLIANALKYCEDTPQIHISGARTGADAVFRIRDNGIGIDPRHFTNLFGVFQRLVARQEYPGTGVGLAICKRILERHGGRIWAESEGPGRGSTFVFSIPAADHAEPRADAAAEK
jgi:light-regulated signal transduction histidine kinase (bacteriophytochrome)